MTVFKAIGAALAALVVVGAVVVGGYQGGWWLKANNTNRQQHIDRKNYGTQLGYITKLESTITDAANIDAQIASPSTPPAEKDALDGQRIAIVRQGCSVAHLITEVPEADQSWVSLNC